MGMVSPLLSADLEGGAIKVLSDMHSQLLNVVL